MKSAFMRVVGRTRFELVTNGLKGRYATDARLTFPLCMARLFRLNLWILPAFCQIPPTSGAV